jgi:hypothetical protein
MLSALFFDYENAQVEFHRYEQAGLAEAHGDTPLRTSFPGRSDETPTF